jgi:hypothetical protein
MRYLTHQFAHLETLERARRWLVHAGFDSSHIEVMTDGIPRIAIRVAPGEAAEAELIIDAAELSDPQGLPSFWDLARQEHIHTKFEPANEATAPQELQSRTFVVGYHILDERPDLGSNVTAIAMREAYIDRAGQ